MTLEILERPKDRTVEASLLFIEPSEAKPEVAFGYESALAETNAVYVPRKVVLNDARRILPHFGCRARSRAARRADPSAASRARLRSRGQRSATNRACRRWWRDSTSGRGPPSRVRCAHWDPIARRQSRLCCRTRAPHCAGSGSLASGYRRSPPQ